MLHILLVEDDVDLATTIVEYLALENMHCDYARTGAHGLQRQALRHAARPTTPLCSTSICRFSTGFRSAPGCGRRATTPLF